MADSTKPSLTAVTTPALTDIVSCRQSGDTRDKKLTAAQLLAAGLIENLSGSLHITGGVASPNNNGPLLSGVVRVYNAGDATRETSFFFLGPDGYLGLYRASGPAIRLSRLVNAENSHNAGVSNTVDGVLDLDGSTNQDGAGSGRAKWWATRVGANVASAGTITPTAGIFHVTGTATISTINLPWTGFTGSITIIPDGIFSTDTAGNIGLASLSVVGRALILVFDGTKWWPNY